jgi:3-oxoadipate enol-lactonase
MERGEGSPVVFLHGYPLNHLMWEPQLRELSNSHRVVLVDLPGYGLASEQSVPDSLAGFAESVHRTLTQRFSRRVVVVGHSFGGYVALHLFRDHPETFRALVLTNTRSEADTPVARAKRLDTIARLERPGESLSVEETAQSLVSPGTWSAERPILEIVRTMIRSARTDAVRTTLRAIAGRPDLTPVLDSVDVPTLVIWGDEDQLIPPAQTQSMRTRVRGSFGVGIPGAGHLPSLEAPESFGRALTAFLERL